ncbi:MAG: hypothetical protein AAF449_03705, partial [Myxococcota bacterium]
MKSLNIFCAGSLAAFAALDASPAFAQQDALIVVVDRSGSMNDCFDSTGRTKWEEAIDRARIAVQVPAIDRAYELWSFSGSSWTQHYTFAAGSALSTTQRQDAMDLALDNLLAIGPGGATPLAGSVCASVDTLTSWAISEGGFPPPPLRIALFSDGLENQTPTTDQCYGPASTTAYDPTNPDRGGLTPGSWEWKVLNKAITGNANNPANPPVTV